MTLHLSWHISKYLRQLSSLTHKSFNFTKRRSRVMTTNWWNPFIRVGSEALLFHGTNRACLLGETPENVMPCRLTQCGLCSIIRKSFDVQRCGSKNSFARWVLRPIFVHIFFWLRTKGLGKAFTPVPALRVCIFRDPYCLLSSAVL